MDGEAIWEWTLRRNLCTYEREIPKGTRGWQRSMNVPQATSSGDSVSGFTGTTRVQEQRPF